MGQEDFVLLFKRLVESQKLDEDTAQLLLKRILILLYGEEGGEAKPPGLADPDREKKELKTEGW